MAGVAVRESATFAGRPDQVREARAFVARLLGPSHPRGDVAILLASELVTNSVRHGGAAVPAEPVTVTVVVRDAGVRVEVTGRMVANVWSPAVRGRGGSGAALPGRPGPSSSGAMPLSVASASPRLVTAVS